MQDRSLPQTTLELAAPAATPHWALLQRQLLAMLPEAIELFHAKYFDERGYLECYPRWGALDGPADAAENVTGWTELYALGGSERVLELYQHGIEGHLQQYTEAPHRRMPAGGRRHVLPGVSHQLRPGAQF